MKYLLSITALAVVLVLLPNAAQHARGADAPPVQQTHATFAIPSISSSDDVDKITTAVKAVKGVTTVANLTVDSKKALVTYDPTQVSAQQIVQAVADVPDKTYQASLLVHVDNLSDTATQDKAKDAVQKVSGVAGSSVTDAAGGILSVQFNSMAAGDKTGGLKGTTQDQIITALTNAGLAATIEIPTATVTQ